MLEKAVLQNLKRILSSGGRFSATSMPGNAAATLLNNYKNKQIYKCHDTITNKHH